MKLREYMNLVNEGLEITCWDSVVDSEFYFYKNEPNEKSDTEFSNVDLCIERLIDILEVVKIKDSGLEVNLYDVLDNPKVIQYAKENLYNENQYTDDADVVMLLFDDNVKNLSQGFEHFSKSMVECFKSAYGDVSKLHQLVKEINDNSEVVQWGTMTHSKFGPFVVLVHSDGVSSLSLQDWGEYAGYGQFAFDHYAEAMGEPTRNGKLCTHGNGYEWETVFKHVFKNEPDFNKLEFVSEAGCFCCRSVDVSLLVQLAVSFKKICEQKDQFQLLVYEALNEEKVANVNKLIEDAKSHSKNLEAAKGKNKYYKTSDGFFDFYVNQSTGEKKFKLDDGDVEVAANLDDFVRE